VSDTRVLLCDLDGVVWRRSEPVQGSIAALGDLIGAGWSVLFITNSSHDPAGHHLDRLLELGVPDGVEVLTSPMAEAVGAEFAHVLTGVDDDRPSAGSSFRDLAAVVGSLLDSEERTDGG